MISVVIPTLNEQNVIRQTITALVTDPAGCEVLVVDGGSKDCTRELVRELGPPVHLCEQDPDGPRGRAAAYNQAARFARGDVLVFLHADTFLPTNGLGLIEAALADRRVVGGGFLPSFVGAIPDAAGLLLGAVERGWRFRTRSFYWFAGDQAPFIRHDVFDACGGYPRVQLAEDWAFASRLRSLGPLATIEQPVRVSARRHLANGVIKTLLVTGSIEVMYRAGVDSDFLARWYHRWLPRERG